MYKLYKQAQTSLKKKEERWEEEDKPWQPEEKHQVCYVQHCHNERDTISSLHVVKSTRSQTSSNTQYFPPTKTKTQQRGKVSNCQELISTYLV